MSCLFGENAQNPRAWGLIKLAIFDFAMPAPFSTADISLIGSNWVTLLRYNVRGGQDATYVGCTAHALRSSSPSRASCVDDVPQNWTCASQIMSHTYPYLQYHIPLFHFPQYPAMFVSEW